MKKCSCIKLYGFTLALFLCISLFAVSPLAAEPVLADGATFEEIKNISIENTDLPPASSFYLYSPSKPHSFDLLSSFLNGVIIVYPDKPYASKAEALAELWDKGLIGIAESAPTYIVVAQPSNGISWSSEDLDLYWVYQYYLSGGYFDIMKGIGQNPMETQFVRHTMQTLQYVIAEGSGATFANNVLSQDAGRIAGLLSFGGDVQPGLKPGYAVPAYLVNTTDAAISYWKTANGTDTRDGNTFVNSGYTQKKVIVAEGSSQFDAAIIRDAWGSLLSRSTRLCVSENLVLKSGEKGDWMLMNWPNLDEIGLNLFSFEFDASTGKANPYGTLETKSLDSVHLYVPDAIKSNPSKAVPLVFVLHGMSDDPLNVVMGCGWADKAVEENFIIIAPATEDADYLIKLLEYAKSQYAIDETRVYCSGFSMGGMNTIQAGFAYPGIFAAAAPMGATGSLLEGADSSYDLPICSVVGSIDTSNVTIDDDGNSVISGIIPGALEQAFSFNEIDPGTADYFQNKYWGYKGDKFSVVKDKDVNWEISDFYKDGYAQPLIKLVTFVGAGHANGDYMATIAWDFFSGFSRSANGAVVETGTVFSDVKTSDWFYKAVKKVSSLGLIAGRSAQVFEPYAGIYVSEFLEIISRLGTEAGLWDGSKSSGEISAYLGLSDMSGSEKLTRAQMAHISSAYLKAFSNFSGKVYASKSPIDFKDIGASAYKEDISWLQTAGGIKGYVEPDGSVSFKPDQVVRRSEAAQVVMQLIES